MKLSIFGATGRVGNVILENALADHHHVKALARNPASLDASEQNLVVYKGNALTKEDVFNAIEDANAVISAMGTDGGTTLSGSIPLIIAAMKSFKVERIITIGTAGILQARSEPGKYRFQSKESRRKLTRAAEEHLMAYEMLRESGLKWTIVCPTYLPDGERTGNYRVEKDFLPENGRSISIYDTADFAYSLLTDRTFLNTRVGIAY
ncbi:NAD(P)-dependent oxidoreductase [Falsibacillus albus]|uniref:NAD(P)-binding domain-containing protein n=1 Tax=Falsibacillus albus TaxID=2478915 RepID=A0A3L7K3W8_9BACI|nr:NAD(P)H-binding protein [Falsibacillus albus]RLQ97335.1 hypothetical protein D9X91_04080 [Falsibacillus albus]